ncbi:MAG TPA: magnesium transporter CorA family protein [Bryobacteraceae bacterium]
MPWYALTDANDPQLDDLAARYGLHSLHIEDCRHPGQRAKIEPGANYLFVVLKPVTILQRTELRFADLCIFIGHDYCITVIDPGCHATADALSRARRDDPNEEPARLFYTIFDTITDSYLAAIDRFDDRIDEIEDLVLDRPQPDVLQEVFRLKRALIELRRVLVNTRDVSLFVQRDAGPLLPADLAPFFRDIYDHVARNLDAVEMLRDLLGNTLDVYLSSVANRTNEVMKVLTILSTVALPAIVISGIYGMNVKYIPFLDAPYGIWIVLGLMAACTIVLLVLLKKFRWL